MTQNVLHKKHSVLPLEVKIGEDYVGEKIAICCENYMEPRNKRYGENLKLSCLNLRC